MKQTALPPAAVILHRQMLDDLQRNCMSGNKDIEKLLASSVFIAEDHLKKLYELIPVQGFTDPDEEILFFKNAKPLFVAEREYYQRLYHGTIFGNGDIGFWEHELGRMEKLLAEYSEFADYYHKGHTHNDYPWFSQGQAPLPTSLCIHPWETNPRHTSARDAWVGGLLAVERYRDWIKAKELIQNTKHTSL
ncbi:MAG: RteC domain-containing protein [Bacteroidota bacterium]